MQQDIQGKIEKLCSFVCNGKTYQYEHKLQKSAEHELYDAAIIYAWNIFMLFVYEKVWQIREVEKELDCDDFTTDQIFLSLTKNKPANFFDGNLFSLNKLHENKQGEDAIVGKLKEIYKTVDQQYFKEVQQILQKRNTAAHVNSVPINEEGLSHVLSELLKITEQIQFAHKNHLHSIFENLEKNKIWYLSGQDLMYLDQFFTQNDTDKFKYIYISRLIPAQEVSDGLAENIKNKAISFFLESGSFHSAYQNSQDLIKPILQYFNADDIKKILKQSFENGGSYNQILCAADIEDIFWDLYQLSSNNFPELEENWNDFAQKIIEENFESNFEKLLLEIQEGRTVSIEEQR